MLENKIIKKEFIFLFGGVLVLLAITISFSYAYFLSIDKGQNNVISIGDIDVSFCIALVYKS